MVKANSLDSHIDPVNTEMTGTNYILMLYICFKDESESEEFLVEKTLSRVYSTDMDKSKIITVNENSTDDSKSECVH